jgi:hypothetical protein
MRLITIVVSYDITDDEAVDDKDAARQAAKWLMTLGKTGGVDEVLKACNFFVDTADTSEATQQLSEQLVEHIRSKVKEVETDE